MAAKKRGPVQVTEEHKAAMAEGREQGRIIRDYLEALRADRPKRGRKRTPESIKERLEKIREQLATADPITELTLIQERADLNTELDLMETEVDMAAVEAPFIKVAAAYSGRKGISYTSWREVGVQPSVLKAAGIKR